MGLLWTGCAPITLDGFKAVIGSLGVVTADSIGDGSTVLLYVEGRPA